jgi:hypothetical protein
MIEPVLRRLRQNRSEAGEHFVHDRLGNRFEAFPMPRGEIESARLVTTNHADRSRPRVVE